ncbi:exonuclease SbcCD subunit D [Streptomyces pristinaespiralis]|uniref:Nuclease SbcCD subunit D n=2 Tax=Streptomyces pristinaespiralis TaxID=38300 RepID=B5HAZ1_STRE2|nr:exonuclease SbcCD subunit D [Streptomyces pristinaespiralis]ALC18344.1 nuclease SbcCD subunit D [Streptomyces pristinaespiralis]ALC25621.1 nuclease SbcCD subunit D [Streptomyces pristinaespiralis]EDY64002.1 nuclease SbcCD [Streptomyces pristinaespiralis ATCC 25486]QMU12203.1 exonuclease SbcCD subunit D [Streptomyces pristinaespiralis]
MKFLHTSDWHVGKTLKGRNRLEEQAGVLREITQIAVGNDVDAVLIAGDLYENAAPTADAQRLVVRTLLQLAKQDIEVVLIAGNHDHGATLEAYKPLMDIAGIHVYGQARPAAKGGVHSFRAKSTDERVNVAVLPFLSQRYAVRAAEIIANTPSQNVGAYDQLIRDVLDNLTGAFTSDAVNIVMAHLTCTGGVFGGGERAAQSIMEYHVPAAIFPVEAHYVALGHLHRRQTIPAACPVHYSGSPYAIDFGEQNNTHVVCLVEASPGTPAKITDIPVTAGRRLRTIEGTVAQLTADPAVYGEDYLRLVITQPAYASMRDDLLEALPNALEIRIHPDHASTGATAGIATHQPTKTPAQLFSDYCHSVGVSDDRVTALFNHLHDDLTRSTARS